jgi:hypothetical protein
MIAEAGAEVMDEAEPEDTEPMIAEVEAEVLDEVAAEDVEPVIAEAEAEAEAEPEASDRAALEPVVIGEGDPWSEEEITGVLKTAEVEIMEEAAIEPAGRREIAVRAEDNQLHLRLQGSGAIVESGQMRELEIEVPVPGSWVGNRRVTLQLRLTLIPDTEDENGESGDPS